MTPGVGAQPADPTQEAQADQALRAFGLADAARTFIRRGENTIHHVRDGGDRRFALRLHRTAGLDPAAIRSELCWMEALHHDAGVPTPLAVAGSDGDVVQRVEVPGAPPTVATLLTWLDGEPIAASDTIAPWEQLGELMGRVHRHGRAWPRPPGFTRPSWDRDAFTGPTPRWGPADELPEWTSEDRTLLRVGKEALADRLQRFGVGPDRFGLVHGDLMFGNVLVAPSGEAALIDFDDCGDGWYVSELAVALYPYEDDPRFGARRDALVRGYRRCRSLEDEELRELPALLMARRLATLGWTGRHADTQHARRERPWRVTTTPGSVRRFLAWSARTPVAS